MKKGYLTLLEGCSVVFFICVLSGCETTSQVAEGHFENNAGKSPRFVYTPTDSAHGSVGQAQARDKGVQSLQSDGNGIHSIGDRSQGVAGQLRSSGYCPDKLTPGKTYCDLFPDGCMRVPTGYTPGDKGLTAQIYFRGLTMYDPDKSTSYLFNNDGMYKLGRVADENHQLVFATRSSTTPISESTLACLLKLTGNRSVDVTAHSGGYNGLLASSHLLSGKVYRLHLADPFYNTDKIRASIANISPSSCDGYYTRHSNKGQSIEGNVASLSSGRTSDGSFWLPGGCVIRRGSNHFDDIEPLLTSTGSFSDFNPQSLATIRRSSKYGEHGI